MRTVGGHVPQDVAKAWPQALSGNKDRLCFIQRGQAAEEHLCTHTQSSRRLHASATTLKWHMHCVDTGAQQHRVATNQPCCMLEMPHPGVH